MALAASQLLFNSLCKATIDIVFDFGKDGAGVNRDARALVVADSSEARHDVSWVK